MIKFEKLKKYFTRRWLNQISPDVLSIYEASIATNNGAESYHSKLNSIIKTCHPRIWTFISNINNLIQDAEKDTGLEKKIIRPRKRKTSITMKKEKPVGKSLEMDIILKRSVTQSET